MKSELDAMPLFLLDNLLRSGQVRFMIKIQSYRSYIQDPGSSMAKWYIVNQYFNKFLWILKYVCCSAWKCKTLKFLHKTKDSGIVDLWLGQPNASKNGRVKSWKKEFLAKIESDDSATNETLFFFRLRDWLFSFKITKDWNHLTV